MSELKEIRDWENLSEDEKIELEKKQLQKMVEELEEKIQEYSFNVKVLNKILDGKSPMEAYKEK